MDNKLSVSILMLRRKIQMFCQKHSRLLGGAFKLAACFVLFLSLHDLYGKTGGSSWAVAVVLALICTGLPYGCIYLASIFLTAFFAFQVSWDLVVFYLAAALLSYLLVGRMEHKAVLITAFAPAFFYLKIPFLLPLLVGMFSNMFGVGAMAFGVLFYYFGIYTGEVSILLSSATGEEQIIAVKNIMDSFSGDTKCLLLLGAFVVSAVVTYLFYHQSFDYAWYLAVAAGGLSGFFVYLAGGLMFDIQGRNLSYLLSILICMAIACIIQFFRCIIDYGSSEYIEFEDDEYYYYVKAVPKVTTIGEDFTASELSMEDPPAK